MHGPIFIVALIGNGLLLLRNVLMLEKQCKLTCSEDTAFAKKRVVAKRIRYKDKFPCELGMIILSMLLCIISL